MPLTVFHYDLSGLFVVYFVGHDDGRFTVMLMVGGYNDVYSSCLLSDVFVFGYRLLSVTATRCISQLPLLFYRVIVYGVIETG